MEFEQKTNTFCSQTCANTFNNRGLVRNADGNNGAKTIEKEIVPKELIKHKDKKSIFELSKNWQSARSIIRRDACEVFAKSEKEYKCAICGYSTHVEIAHIKAVSEFSDDALLIEINHIDNLVGLCPTHHWEYDNRLIDL